MPGVLYLLYYGCRILQVYFRQDIPACHSQGLVPVPEVNAELLHADELDTNGQAFYTDLYTMIDTLPLPYR